MRGVRFQTCDTCDCSDEAFETCDRREIPDWVLEAISLFSNCIAWGVLPSGGGIADQDALTMQCLSIVKGIASAEEAALAKATSAKAKAR